MKTNYPVITLAAVFAASAVASLMGAAPQPAAKPGAPAPAMACTNCKTTVYEEFAATYPSGKGAPRYVPVGTRHECKSCGGAITTARGVTTSDMKANCPTCAKAAPGCCTK